jgi:hypothetical protein
MSGWLRVARAAFQRRVDLPGASIIARVRALDAKRAQWGAVVTLRAGRVSLCGLDEEHATADAAQRACDALLEQVLSSRATL